MKYNFYQKIFTLAFFMLSVSSINAQLFINEFLASNESSITDELGQNEDWIEIYNAGSTDVDLANYYISDDITSPLLWQIPSGSPALTTVPAGGYLILWADKDIADGANHINIKLGSGGEDIILTNPNGSTIIDQYTFGQQAADISFGRIGDGGTNWDLFGEPTPNDSNDTAPGAPQVATPVASINGGFYSGSISVSLSTDTPDADIYYTTDGSKPTVSSNLYSSTISITENTPLRAKAFLSPLIPSVTKTETYLFDTDHVFPVVAYTADPEEMFDPATGMYPNFLEDIEININAEMFEPDGSTGFNQIVETEINGTGSASADQKSLALKAKGSLGSSTIDHQVFPLSDRNEYRSLIIRNSGQDNNITQFRDAMATSLFWDVSDLNGTRLTIQDPEIFGQAYRPGVTYINGEYWGILNIRERTDKRYIRVHFGLDDDEIDYIENNNEVKEGDIVEWDILEEFLEDNSLVSESNFQFVDDRVDLSHYIDYLAFNIYIDNSDWPGNNVRRFREKVPGSQWRWLTYDLDFTFGLFVEGQGWNSGFNDANSLNRLLTLNGYGWPNPDYSTLMFRRLIENDAWRTRFVNRMADQLNLMYNDDRVVGRIDAFENEYSPEIDQHIDRWSGYLEWNNKIQILRNFANGRADNVRDHFVDELDDVTGISDVTINLNSATQGEVELSTISVHENNAPFTGKYFRGVDIPVTAFPNRGFVLQSWSGALSGNDPSESININSNTSVTANFGPGSSASDPIVINEINYNSSDVLNSDDWVELYNPNSSSVNISGWYFEDEGGNFFGMPANTILAPGAYLVLAENGEKFSEIYPQVNNFIGDFGRDPRGFGLSGGGELITLKNANGVLIDAVEYDDKAPWPVEADGDGPTLQLINPGLDNALASSWVAIPATPGALNGSNQGQNQTINFSSISDQLTTNAPFSINATATSGLNVSFNIISGPATISGNIITLSGAPGTVTVQANQAGNANWNPAPSINQSFSVTTPPIGGDYCDAQGDAPWLEWIARVELNTIDNSSGKNQYSDFTNLSTTLNAGSNYDLRLTTGFSWTTFDEYFRVWIDYNGNGVFEEPAEVVYSGILSGISNGTPEGAITSIINIPNNAPSGTTRMRVSMQRGAYASPCGSFPFGEVEDYTIVIGEGGPVTTLTVNNCPSNIVETAAPGQSSVSVNWNAPTASTDCPGNAVFINQTSGPSSGSSFNAGTTTTIVYTISDLCGNSETCSFNVTVNEANNGSISLDCPADIVITSEPGLNGATVSWSQPSSSTSCPTGGLNVSQTGGAPNGSFFAVGNYQIAYAATDNCSNSTSCTFNIQVLGEPTGGEYCESSSGFPWHDYISNVQINTLNNPSSKTTYSDFTNMSTNLSTGMTYDLILTASFSWTTYDEYWSVWIDYNGNGVFEEPSETAFQGILSAPPNGTESAFINGLITVPANAASGQTRMRVSMSRDAYAGPCDEFGFGEVEDYTVNIPNNINGNQPQGYIRNLSEIEIFPSPAHNEVTIILEEEMDLENIEIYNLATQSIFYMDGKEGESIYKFNVSQWKEGMYFVQFKLKNGQRISKRFIVNSRF